MTSNSVIMLFSRSKTEARRPPADSSTGSTGVSTQEPSCRWVVWPTSSRISVLCLATLFPQCVWESHLSSSYLVVLCSSPNLLMAVPSQIRSRSCDMPAVPRNPKSQSCFGQLYNFCWELQMQIWCTVFSVINKCFERKSVCSHLTRVLQVIHQPNVTNHFVHRRVQQMGTYLTE